MILKAFAYAANPDITFRYSNIPFRKGLCHPVRALLIQIESITEAWNLLARACMDRQLSLECLRKIQITVNIKLKDFKGLLKDVLKSFTPAFNVRNRHQKKSKITVPQI